MARKETIDHDQALFDARLQRIQSVLGVKTQVKLAEKIGVRQSSISDAKRRCSIPDGWLLEIWRQTGYSPLWLLHGDEAGHRFLVPTMDPVDGPVDCVSLRERIEAQVRAELDNLHLEDLIARLRTLCPDAQITIGSVGELASESELVGMRS